MPIGVREETPHAWVAPSPNCFRYSPVLCRVKTSLGVGHDGVKARKKLVRSHTAIGKVQGKGCAFHRKRQHARRMQGPTCLEDSEKRRLSTQCDLVE